MPDTPKLITALCDADKCATNIAYLYSRVILYIDEAQEEYRDWLERSEDQCSVNN